MPDSLLFSPKVPKAPESVGDDHWDALIQPDRVHSRLYTDDEIFRRELTHIWGRCWLFVGHESEIPEPMDFKTVTVGRRNLILTRTRAGDIHVLFNRCTHRGTQICRAEKGRSKVFVCPYHGWSFRNDGTLFGLPHDEGYGGRPEDGRWDLAQAARVDTYHGLIFASFVADVPPLTEWLGHARPILDKFLLRSGFGPLTACHGAHRMLVRANWKTCWDNSTDGYHAETSHRSITMLSQKRYQKGKSLSHFDGSPDDTPMYQMALGNGHTFLDQSPAMGNKWQRARPMPGREAAITELEDRADLEDLLEDLPGPGLNLNIFPNLMMIGNQLVMIEPVSVGEFAMIWYATQIDGVPDSANTIRMRVAEDFPNLGEVDDADIWERMQHAFETIPEAPWIDMSRGLHTDRVDPETGVIHGLVTSDAGMRSYYAHYKRMMTTT